MICLFYNSLQARAIKQSITLPNECDDPKTMLMENSEWSKSPMLYFPLMTTTIELKSNFLGTAREGSIACVATKIHSGRTTQVWDATVTDETSGKTIALVRCTQLILYPR